MDATWANNWQGRKHQHPGRWEMHCFLGCQQVHKGRMPAKASGLHKALHIGFWQRQAACLRSAELLQATGDMFHDDCQCCQPRRGNAEQLSSAQLSSAQLSLSLGTPEVQIAFAGLV